MGRSNIMGRSDISSCSRKFCFLVRTKLSGVNVICNEHQKEAVNPSSLFEPQRYIVPRLMMAQEAFDSVRQSFVFIFIVQCIITFSDAWMRSG